MAAGNPVQCREFDNQITAAVDKRLAPGDARDFRLHATACPRCRCEYQKEAFTKRFVNTTLRLVPVPSALLERILRALDRARQCDTPA